MNKRIVYTNSNSSKLFDENISYLKIKLEMATLILF